MKKEIDRYTQLDYKHIVKYYGCEIIENNVFCIYLEYMLGKSIVESQIQTRGYILEPLCKAYVKQVLKALNFLHNKEIIHGDIKGTNILCDKNGENVKLCDLGNSLKLSPDRSFQSVSSFINGTLPWMAPETFHSKIGKKSDIWSVGCLMIEMLSGENPWSQKIFDSQHSAIMAIS